MNITRNLLHEWYHGGARTPADVQRLAQENLGLTLTAEKVKRFSKIRFLWNSGIRQGPWQPFGSFT